MTTTFVLVAGKRRCGKDSFGAALVRHLPDAVLAHFADELKKRYAAQANVDLHRLLTDDAFKEVHRPHLIALGARERQHDPLFWARLLLENYRDKHHHRFVVVCDLRFSDEREFFHRTAVFVKVTATTETRAQRGWTYNEAVDTDASEVELDALPDDSWLTVVDNNGSADELEQAAERVAAWCLSSCV
jgi:phosphomevalonate kinase